MKRMTHGIMPAMMAFMMGHGPMHWMKDRMKDMEDSQSSEQDGSPWDMCHNMMASFHEHVEATKFATPELRQLFEEWLEQIEQEIVEFVEKAGEVDPEKIAGHFKLSNESIMFLLTRLAKKGKIRFTV